MYNVATWGIYKYHSSLTRTNMGNFSGVQEEFKCLLPIHVPIPECIVRQLKGSWNAKWNSKNYLIPGVI